MRKAVDSAIEERRDVTEHGLRRVLIVSAVMAAALMQTLDTTITNVALPTIQGNLGASVDEGTWIVTAYTIAAIVVIPLTPWLQHRFGRRNYFVTSIVGFTLASIVCGASSSLNVLILARVVQGAFGGGLLATAQAILRDTFPPEGLGISQGIFAMGAILGPALGPPLGGILVDNYSWNWVFDINILPGLFSAIVLFAMLKDPDLPQHGRVDVVGLVLLATGLAAMQYVLTEGERNYWFDDPTITSLTILMALSLAAFCYWELNFSHAPVVDLRILRNRTVAAGTVLALALGAAIFGSTYILPQFTQGMLGFTPTISGALFILRAVPIILATPFVVRFSGRIDARIFLGVGFFLIALGSWTQAEVTTSQADFWSFAVPLALTGLGASFLFVPLSIAVLGATTPSEGPKAGAFVNLATQLGGSIAVAALAVIVDRRQTLHYEALAGNVTAANVAVTQFLLHNTLGRLAFLVRVQAQILSYADATVAIAIMTILCVPLVFFMRKPKPTATPVEVGG
jgi:DHA2 family multidrug resistance protein